MPSTGVLTFAKHFNTYKLISVLQPLGKYYYPHFRDEDNKAQRDCDSRCVAVRIEAQVPKCPVGALTTTSASKECSAPLAFLASQSGRPSVLG
jgi:hypothetical protein